jgi:type IV pilus assembly protein PilW
MKKNHKDYLVIRPSSRSLGFSLIEMMIAMTIGLMLIGALATVVIGVSKSAKSNDKTAELQNNGRYAMDIMKRDLQHAGHHGLTGADINPPITTIAVTSDCASSFAINLKQYIWGTNNANSYGATCIPNYQANTDTIVIRYASLAATPSTPSAAPDLTVAGRTTNSVLFRSAYGVGAMYQGVGAPTSVDQLPQQDHNLETHFYYVSPFTVSATELPVVPSLRRVVLGPDGAMLDELVASGVEQLQVQYGVLDANGNTEYLDATSVDASASGTTTAKTNWDRVRSVRIWISSRNMNAEESTYINPLFNMGDQTATSLAATAVADGTQHHRRQLFTTTVQLRN